MMYKYVITDYFKRQLKPLIKKDMQIKERLVTELRSFSKEQAISVGKGVYKIRVGGLNKGKSGGYRVYLLLVEIDYIMAPLCIYAKKELENLSMIALTKHLENTLLELDDTNK